MLNLNYSYQWTSPVVVVLVGCTLLQAMFLAVHRSTIKKQQRNRVEEVINAFEVDKRTYQIIIKIMFIIAPIMYELVKIKCEIKYCLFIFYCFL